MTTAEASVRVVADATQFRAEMLRLQRDISNNSAKINKSMAGIGSATNALAGSFRMVTRLAGAFGVALSIRALSNFTMQSINAAAELHNLSTRLNVSVESMSELQHVARVTDVEFGTFSKSLQIMARNFGEASKGSKSMRDTFRQLGLDFNLLSQSSVDVQLEAVAEALMRVTDEGQRAAFAQEVLGRGGVEMLQSFEGGAAGVRALRQELRDLGAVTSTETAKAADEAKDAMDRLKASMTGLRNALVDELAPALTTVADKLRVALFPNDAEAAAKAAKAEFEDRNRLLREASAELAKYQAVLAQDPDSKNTSLHTRIDELTRRVSLLKSEAFDAQIALESLLTAQAAGAAKPPTGGAVGLGAPGKPPTLAEQFPGLQRIGGIEAAGKSTDEANEQFRKNEQELTAIVKEEWDQRLQAATDATEGMLEVAHYQAEQEIVWRKTVADSAIGLLSALGAKHRGAAIAALAIQKALAVKEILVQSQVAAMRALAELGPIAGPPVAASFLAKGKISAALVAATGLVEAAQVSSGGTQSTLGTTANPVNTRSTSNAGPNIVPHSQKVVEITIHGGAWSSNTVRELAAQIKREIDDSDVVIISPDSRQGRLLGAAA